LGEVARYALIVAVCGWLAGCGSSGGADAGRDTPGQDGGGSDVAVDVGDATDVGDVSDAALDDAGDGRDAPADAPSIEAAPQCGNEPHGPVDCVVPGIGCQDCRLTEFVLCLRADGTEWPCVNLQGADLVACETLVECAFQMYQRTTFLEGCGYVTSDECRFGFADRPYCYCSDQTCSKGAISSVRGSSRRWPVRMTARRYGGRSRIPRRGSAAS
jgi:hypothetical protein